MKTDKELLELAAKAAGVSGEWVEDFNPTHDYFYSGSRLGFYFDETGNGDFRVWNPLTDDGDALRLASALNLIVDTAHDRAIEAARLIKGHNDWICGESDFGNDDLTSTRRAIVRAAAAIGERL